MQILVLPGDGIGPEITAATRQVLEAASKRFALGLDFIEDVVGHESLQKHGTTVRPEIVEEARQADGIILGPTATADFKDPTRGEINPSMFFRKTLDLFANIRPARTYSGLPARVGAFDLVVVRENTEGFYADRNMEVGSGEMLVTPDVAISLRRITRACCNRIARVAFELAAGRRQHVTIVHKANVLKRDRHHQHVWRHPLRPHGRAIGKPRARGIAQRRYASRHGASRARVRSRYRRH
jgi:3-isopropylmalate dehydrogenase